MKTLATLAAALLVFGLAGLAEARDHAGKRAHAGKHDALRGNVQSVAADGKSLVVTHKGTTVTVTLDASTQIRLKTAKREKAHAGAMADLHAGERVKIKPATGTAQKIVVLEFPKKHHKRGAAA